MDDKNTKYLSLSSHLNKEIRWSNVYQRLYINNQNRDVIARKSKIFKNSTAHKNGLIPITPK